jgi:hypothetical protein
MPGPYPVATKDAARSILQGRCWSHARALGATALLSVLAACAARPALEPAAPGVAGAVVQDAGALQVSVTAGAWQGRPRGLPEHVLPFLVVVRNTGSAPLAIARGDFVLLDQSSRQYLPLPPAEVVALLGGSSSGVAVSPSIGIGGSTGGGGTIFGGGLGIALGGGHGGDARDVISRALPEGPVQPAAEVAGFLYFPRPAAGYQTLRLVFAPQAAPGSPRVDFPFRPKSD